MLDSPIVRLIIHACAAGALAVAAALEAGGDTRALVVAFITGAAGFSGYGVVSPTYKGVGVGKKT